MPTNIQKLRDKLAEEILPDKRRRRISPLGITEYIIPPELQAKYFDDPGTLATTIKDEKGNPFINYREGWETNPELVTHEHIHAGQEKLKNPNLYELIKSLGITPQEAAGMPGYGGKFGNFEIPAYEFQSQYRANPGIYKYARSKAEKDKILQNVIQHIGQQQNRFNNYIDLMYGLNQGNSIPLEVMMPEGLMREYVSKHPRPILKPRFDVK